MLKQPLKPEPGEMLRETFAGGESRTYLVSLEKGQYLDLNVEQQGIDVRLVFRGPGRDELVVDSPNGSWGPERLVVLARGSGDHELEVVAAAEATKPGEVLLNMPEHTVHASRQDERRALAHETLAEADEQRRRRTAESVGHAIEAYRKALALWKELDDPLWQATAWHRLAQAHRMLGRSSDAVDGYRRAGELYTRLGETAQFAKTRNLIGRIELAHGRVEQARALFHEAREVARALGESAASIEATAANNLGELHRQAGESQEAFDHYDAARELWRRAERPENEAAALHNMGTLLHQQGKLREAADVLAQSLELHHVHSRHDPSLYAGTLSRLASVRRDLGEVRRAIEDLEKALGIFEGLDDERGTASVFNNLGLAYRTNGDLERSFEAFRQGLGKFERLEDLEGVALVELNLARLHLARQQPDEALALFKKASSRFRELGQPDTEASAYYGIAWALRDLDRREEALEQLDVALALVEDLRTRSSNQDLRIAFFASRQHYYDMKIAILMELGRPELVRQALETSEQRRARALLDVMGEAAGRLRQDVRPGLLEDERRIQDELRALEADLRAAHSANSVAQGLEGLKIRRRELVLRLGDVRGKMRAEHPLYSELVRPKLLKTEDIRSRVLGQETLLLVYSLGPDRSYLWSLVPDGELTSHVLEAGREDIERRVAAARSALAEPSRSARRRRAQGRGILPPELDELSELLLGKVRQQLGGKRLVIVADGALRTLPFAALPHPDDENGRPIVVRHEIVYLSSISLLAHTRELWGRRHAAKHKLAVIADPVYRRDDPRFDTAGSPDPERSERSPNQRDLEQALRASGLTHPVRLPSTGEEARAIADMIARQDMRQVWLAFEASRDTVFRKRLKDYRMLHFATHGILNAEQPELSGLVLSLYDREGRRRDGFLYANEIYNLELRAELVVLSACETGLGKNVRGEGMLGLTRAFMYAGAPRVVVSLWQVSDQSTAELMRRVYENIIEKGHPYAAALRHAQVSMLEDSPWSDPYYWAAFSFLGDWRKNAADGRDAPIEAEDEGVAIASDTAKDKDLPSGEPT